MNDYEKQAQDFLDATGTTIEKKFLKCDKYFDDDKDNRNIWEITLKRGYDIYTFTFGDSIENTQDPILPKGLDKGTYQYWVKYGEEQFHKYFGLGGMHKMKLIKQATPKEPTNYDILACLDLVYEDSLEDWCSSYGYDADSRKVEGIYKKCLEQDRQLRRMFDRKELEMLQEIS